jgi:hypothetical protein
MSRIDELNNDKKNLKRLVELVVEMYEILKRRKQINKTNDQLEIVEQMRCDFITEHNEIVKEIAIEEHGIK